MRFHDESVADTIVDAVLSELGDRKGFNQFWDDIDEDIQDETIITLHEIVAGLLHAAY